MRVIFAESATSDLKSIARYIAQDNVQRAKSFSKELRETCQKLGNNPARFVRVSGYNNVRKRAHGKYVIFYRVNPDAVEILHIFHGSMSVDEADFEPEKSAQP